MGNVNFVVTNDAENRDHKHGHAPITLFEDIPESWGLVIPVVLKIRYSSSLNEKPTKPLFLGPKKIILF